MRLFSLISLKFENFYNSVRSSLTSMLSGYGENLGTNTIFGQIISVMGSISQNILTYIEDAITEHNKYTAQRKRSIYSLAELSGYNPSPGKAASAVVELSWKPSNTGYRSVVIPNHTKLLSSQSGLSYNIILSQESVVFNLTADNAVKNLCVVEGTFETQTFVAEGGRLYTRTISFKGDWDPDYLNVSVNGETWTREECLYDLEAEQKGYVAKNSMKNGIDLLFGNGEHGKPIATEDVIKVTYLIHSGEMGNINYDSDAVMIFQDTLQDTNGDEVNPNQIFNVEIKNRESINAGMYSDDIEYVRHMIGMNSRSLVLADPKNYKKFIDKFSFTGYSRIWSEPGSMIINGLVTRNYRSIMNSGIDYFNLSESDFYLTDDQKTSIYNLIDSSGEQLAGAVFTILDPEIAKYACYMYVKLKDTASDRSYVRDRIRDLVGEFFSQVQSDIFIPKSDIYHLLKSEIEEIDGVSLYFISCKNEQAIIRGYYVDKTYKYDPSTGTYHVSEKTVYLDQNENPGLGLDAHGNILLDNNDQFPVLMGGWKFKKEDMEYLAEPLTIIFE